MPLSLLRIFLSIILFKVFILHIFITFLLHTYLKKYPVGIMFKIVSTSLFINLKNILFFSTIDNNTSLEYF